MGPKWIQILAILVFYQKMTSGADNNMAVKEGETVEIVCTPPDTTSTIIWFRALDSSGMEFIASFSQSGMEKGKKSDFSEIFSKGTTNKHAIKVKSFKKSRDSGIYGCASVYRGTELRFGTVTRLFGEEIRKDTPGPPPTKPPNNQVVTVAPCDCNDRNRRPAGAIFPVLPCSILILGPLAGGCGLLLLILVVTIVYCNRIRTRRCPHHYKRKPRVAPEKQMMTNRHV